MSGERGVLYIATCATPAAAHIGRLIDLAQQAGWTTCLLVTPNALKVAEAGGDLVHAGDDGIGARLSERVDLGRLVGVPDDFRLCCLACVPQLMALLDTRCA